MPLFLSGCWRSASRALPGREGKEIIAPRARKNASQKLTAFFIRVLLGRGQNIGKDAIRQDAARQPELGKLTMAGFGVFRGIRECGPPSFSSLLRSYPFVRFFPFSPGKKKSPVGMNRRGRIQRLYALSSVLPEKRRCRTRGRTSWLRKAGAFRIRGWGTRWGRGRVPR